MEAERNIAVNWQKEQAKRKTNELLKNHSR